MKLYNGLSSYILFFEAVEKLFSRLQTCIKSIDDSYDRMGNIDQSLEWFNVLISVVPTDPGVLSRMANIYVRDNDRGQAFQSYSEVKNYIIQVL